MPEKGQEKSTSSTSSVREDGSMVESSKSHSVDSSPDMDMIAKSKKKKVIKKSPGDDLASLNPTSKLVGFVFKPLEIFSVSSYEVPDIPEEQIIEFQDDDGEVVGYAIEPKVERNWVCNYYHYPTQKVRLIVHMFLAGGIFFLGLSALTQSNMPGAIPCMVISALLFLNFLFRYNDWAVYKYPMPEIPILSRLNFGDIIDKARDNLKREENMKKEYEELVESDDVIEYVPAVKNYRDGNPSPATILTNWMNTVAEWSSDDLIENSDGKINRFAAKMLLDDDPTAWGDEELVDTISKITGSHPQQWEKALVKWMESEDDESNDEES